MNKVNLTLSDMLDHLSKHYQEPKSVILTVLRTPTHPKDLRDYFAAKAMQALLTTITQFPDEHWRKGLAIDSYSMADAMIDVRGI